MSKKRNMDILSTSDEEQLKWIFERLLERNLSEAEGKWINDLKALDEDTFSGLLNLMIEIVDHPNLQNAKKIDENRLRLLHLADVIKADLE